MVRAQCLLADSKYKEAQEEAEDILKNDKNNAVALFISAESMYFRCNVSPSARIPQTECSLKGFHLQFEKALMTFHQGYNARSKLYTHEFSEGVKKSKVAILRTLTALDLSIADWKKGAKGKRLEKDFRFYVRDLEDRGSKTALDEFLASQDLTFDTFQSFSSTRTK